MGLKERHLFTKVPDFCFIFVSVSGWTPPVLQGQTQLTGAGE